MYAKLALKLRRLRSSAAAIPKKGKPPKTTKHSQEELSQRFFIFCLGIGLPVVLLCYWENIALYYSLHLAVQILIVTICLTSCKEFFKKLLRLKAEEAFYWLLVEAPLSLQFTFSIALTYGAQLLSDALRPYVDNLWQQLHGTLTNPETYAFYIYSDMSFYQTWLTYTLVFTGLFFVGKLFYRRAEKKLLADDFRLWLGESTGKLTKLSHGTGLAPKQQVALSLEDAAKNILIMGGIGTGKTTRIVHPLLFQLIDQNCGGFIFDIKGDFHSAVKTAFSAVFKQNQLRIIGTGHEHINLIEGLTPEMAASFLRSSLLLNSAEPNEKFWLDTATQLCNNALGMLSFFPKQYHLAALHEYIFNPKFRSELHAEADNLSSSLDTTQTRLLNNYRHYYEHIFSTFDDKMKKSIEASVAHILAPFLHPTLTDLFCRHSDIRIQDMLDGTTFLVDLPLAKWGMGGKVAYNLLKLRFFNLMQQRANESTWNQERPVFFLCDEYQEIVSGAKDGYSDLNFWDKSRSTKTIGIISAQSVSSFYAAIGHRDIANAVLQNFRQKICFKTEDQNTLDLLNDLTGTVDVAKHSISRQSGSSFGSKDAHSNKHRSKTETITWVTKPVIDPQLVRTLEPHQAIALLTIQGHSCDDVMNTMQVSV